MLDPKVTQPYFGQPNKVIRVTSLEQLSLAQFIGELVRPKQEFIREGQTETAIILCKLNKSL